MNLATADHHQKAEQRAGVEERNEGAKYRNMQEVYYGVQKNIHKDHADQGNETTGNQSEDLAKYGTDCEKDEQIFSLTAEVCQYLGLYVKGFSMPSVGVDAVILVEFIEADGIDNQHDNIGYQGLDDLVVKLIENGGDDDGAEHHGDKGDKDRQGHVHNTGTDGIFSFS